MKRAAKKSAALAKLDVPRPAPIVRDQDMIDSRPDVIGNAMMGRVQELVAMTAHMAASNAKGTISQRELVQYTAGVQQITMMLAHQGLALQAEHKRLQEIRDEERNVVLLANQSGQALKLLRMLATQFGADWRFERHNDETGVTASVPMGRLIASLLDHKTDTVTERKPTPVLTEQEHQEETTKARLRAAGGELVPR